MVSPIRILVVDSSIDFVESAASLLALEPIVYMVGYALTGAEAIEKIVVRNPDIVLVNWTLSDTSGLQLTQKIKVMPNPPCVILLSLSDFPIYRSEAEQAGADRFLPKAEWGTEFFPTIRKMFQLPPLIADSVAVH